MLCPSLLVVYTPSALLCAWTCDCRAVSRIYEWPPSRWTSPGADATASVGAVSQQSTPMTINSVLGFLFVCLAWRVPKGRSDECAVSITEPRDGAKLYADHTDPPFVAIISLPACPQSRRRSVTCNLRFMGGDDAFAPTFANVFSLQYHTSAEAAPLPLVSAHPSLRYSYQLTRKSDSLPQVIPQPRARFVAGTLARVRKVPALGPTRCRGWATTPASCWKSRSEDSLPARLR